MTQSDKAKAVVVEIGDLHMEHDNPFNKMAKLALCTSCPALAKLSKLKTGEKIDTVLLSEMKAVVDEVYSAQEVQKTSNEKEKWQAIKDISPDKTQPARIVAAALLAHENGEDVAEAVAKEYQVFRGWFEGQAEKDLTRDAVILDINGEKYVVKSADQLKKLFPELTGEQAGYIIQAGVQQLVENAGFDDASNLLLEGALPVGNDSESSVIRYVEIKDVRVKLVSSKKFGMMIMSDGDVVDFDPNDAKEQYYTSIVTDITDLRGEEFMLGAASAKVPSYYVVESENTKLLENVTKKRQKHALPSDSLEAKQVLAVATGARERGASLQTIVLKGDTARTPEEKAELVLKDRSKQPYEKVQALEGASPEFAARVLADEYEKDSKLWTIWLGSKEIALEEKMADMAMSPLDDLSKAKTRIAIYAELETNTAKRIEFTAKTLSELPKGTKLKENEVQEILGPIIPKGKTLANVNQIAAGINGGIFQRNKTPQQKAEAISEKLYVVLDSGKAVRDVMVGAQKHSHSPDQRKTEKGPTRTTLLGGGVGSSRV